MKRNVQFLKSKITFFFAPIDDRIEFRQRAIREERDVLRRNLDGRQDEMRRRFARDEQNLERRNDLSRRGLYGFLC